MNIITPNLTTTVETVLANSPRARQDDKFLELKVWMEQGLPITTAFAERFLGADISSPESIRRTRQKLQEQGKYLPPKPVVEARQVRAKQTRVQMVQGSLL